MSSDQPLCLSSGSTDKPRIFTLRLSNSGFMAAMVPSSVVHTGVKSFGCENNTPQLSPRYSCRLMVPSVVSAVKSGASSPKRNAMVRTSLLVLRMRHQAMARHRRMSSGEVGIGNRLLLGNVPGPVTAPEPTRKRSARARMRGLAIDLTPLRASRDFRLIWFGELVSQIGSQITLVALLVQMYALTHSAAAVGL